MSEMHLFRVGDVLAGKYRIERELGRGGMGVVVAARHVELGELFAIKLLFPGNRQKEQGAGRFLREARASARLTSDHVAKVYDLGYLDNGVPYMIMEYLAGNDLKSVLESCGALPAASVVELVMQVCDAVAEAHGLGLVHRDLKPANLFLTRRRDGRPFLKVLDFGISKHFDAPEQLTRSGEILGTPLYMAPEQMGNAKSIDGRCDIWSVGVIMYELLTGQAPFKGMTLFELIANIATSTPEPPSRLQSTLPPELDEVVLRCLRKEPQERYPQIEELARALASLSPQSIQHSNRPFPWPSLSGSQASEHRPSQLLESTERPLSVTHIQEDTGLRVALAASVPAVVGRAVEEAEIESTLRMASSGQGRLLCVTGEPGLGKTTLVEDFLHKLPSGKPWVIARGRCSERLAGTEAYLPVIEALESLFGAPHHELVAELLKQHAPTWYFRIAPVMSMSSRLLSLREEARAASQERMKREFFTFLQKLSHHSQLILSLDDVHWADASTVDLLGYIGLRMQGLPMLTIVTYRPTDLMLANHVFLGVKRELESRGICHELPLRFLTRADVARYADIAFPGHEFPESFIDFVHLRTEGSPLFFVNILRYLQTTGALHHAPRWRLARPLAEITQMVPDSIRSMIERKIHQLDEEERRLLAMASIQGAEFDTAVVAQCLDADEEDVEELLERLDRIQAFVRRVTEEECPNGAVTVRYRFVHALYQKALYDTLAPTRRAKASAKVAQALVERHQGATAKIAGELAMLYEVARDFEHASSYFLEAARTASTVYANHEAVELCRRGIDCANKLQGKARDARIVMGTLETAQLHMTLSRFEDAVSNFELAEQAAERCGMVNEQIHALCGRAMSLYNLKRISEMRAVGERALELARSIGSAVGIASAELVLACQLLCLGDLQGAQPLFDRSVPILRDAGLEMQALEGVIYGAALHTWRNEYAQAYRLYIPAIGKAKELGSGFAIVAAYFFRSMTLGNEGRIGEAMDTLHEARRIAELNRERYWLPRLPNTIAWLHRELGDFEQSKSMNLENIQIADEFGMPEGAANAHINLAGTYLDLAEPALALGHLDKARAIFGEDVWFRWRYNIRLKAEYARHAILTGDLLKAREFVEASAAAALQHAARKHQAWSHKLRGDIAVLEDDLDAAARHFDNALAILDEFACPTVEWRVLDARAAVACKRNDSAAADALRARARHVTRHLAEATSDARLRAKFLSSERVRTYHT